MPKRKLRICLVSIAIPPDFEDGAAKFFRGIFDYLRARGHDVTLITGKWTHDLDDPDIVQVDILRQRFLWFPQFTLSVWKYPMAAADFALLRDLAIPGPPSYLPVHRTT